LYPRSGFISEARRLGVNRAIAAAVLKKMEWGQPILVADFPKERVTVQEVERGRRKEKKRVYLEGTAVIFGYFTVDNVTLIGLTVAARKEFFASLNVARSWAVNERVVRACGSYIISGSAEVRNSLAEVVEKGEEIAKKYGLKIRWFVGGRYHPLEAVKIPGVKFFRGYMPVELEEVPQPGESPKDCANRNEL
jgi:hypothetical protein